LKSRCINLAIDQWYTRRQKDAEGDFYRQLATQAGAKDFAGTTQGLYLSTPDGKLLGFTNHRSPDRVRDVLEKGLGQFVPAPAALLENPKPDPNYNYRPPAGGLVLSVTSKVLAGYDAAPNLEIGFFQNSLGRDVAWLRKDETEALVRGELVESLIRRLCLYNLLDNTRGEPHPWSPQELRKMDVRLKDGLLSGFVHLETSSGDRGYQADLRGQVETKAGQVTRLDVVARGQAWGASGCTLVGKPKDRFTLAVAFRIAPGTDEADKVMPQGAKSWLPDYLR
jgi:hypothetical protein